MDVTSRNGKRVVLPVLITVISAISGYRTQLLPVTAQCLRRKLVLLEERRREFRKHDWKILFMSVCVLMTRMSQLTR